MYDEKSLEKEKGKKEAQQRPCCGFQIGRVAEQRRDLNKSRIRIPAVSRKKVFLALASQL
ncbi:hypothetical protein A2962_05345 [Candidatus Woesebacteria bacterium RIFCSPLOWO2_01_FULL_39_61]|uniref:Uncharacterized protein n=1 Tax=Candidatus Woesebacteria bacterium RIFCSPHIGHO2_02_FULL_39_13 TaxID=1802505 RepID=A0A1F7Z557_9BACT|nr:MAG: hypothetical protein A2692_05690 [Candidatus Woesebacteria bacterium RIFCSPHIGHO2_01_FULL_39_95]OGM33895.1 MAG: hypothetical protein A3D01_05740 [Candidatus Woesebacteria bacterium RIFCSPHIGHO2_02_FULL_39_13]OGM37184.1 MAG: hypothetical protein A3E13_03070 [Candidatus Woesebacteria bacterium RIFCSPHIGHO2_12_FULL_40_20]OGM68306.1 MAG: hypothetical protein A2962_05345 [Candidatus Woesebacteria bacterium RIFCSPLOWO2_01_FULL_39_61]OGM74052.1 MAG: hypothetical protein A3H19_02385 [Candidatus